MVGRVAERTSAGRFDGGPRRTRSERRRGFFVGLFLVTFVAQLGIVPVALADPASPLSVVKTANPNPDYFSYTLSKAALDAATTLLAQALATRVRVCCVAPG